MQDDTLWSERAPFPQNEEQTSNNQKADDHIYSGP